MKISPQPVSLRLDADTMRRATAFAKRRKVGVTTALRMLINDHLLALENEESLGSAMRWQQKETLATLAAIDSAEMAEVSLAQLRKTHARVLRSAQKK